MDLVGSVLLMARNNPCTDKLLQTLKQIITGELTGRQKYFHLLPIGPQFSSSVCGGSVAAVQQHFAMAKRFLSYNDLKGHHASPMFKLRPHSNPEKIQ